MGFGERIEREETELLREIANQIKMRGGDMFYVGGCVRDEILGKENKDVDVEVYGISPDELVSILSMFGGVDYFGKSFGVYRIKGLDVDFSFPRVEKSVGAGHRDFDVQVNPFLDTVQAAIRRDFTINALMKNVLTGEVVDHFDGINDLRKGIIRHISEETFGDDPLRVLRAAQFAARFEFTVHPETIALAKRMPLHSLPRERIYVEWQKLLMKGNKPSLGLIALKEMDVLRKLHPHLMLLEGCIQPSEHHPEGDAFAHTALVIDEAAKLRARATNPEALMWAALLHDIGKPSTTKVEADGKITAHDHAAVGAKLVDEFFVNVSEAQSLISDVRPLVAEHMTPLHLFRERDRIKDGAIRRLFNRVNLHDLLLLAEADDRGRGVIVSKSEATDWLRARVETLDIREDTIQPWVTGKHLIQFGLRPGPIFKSILSHAYECQLDGWSEDEVFAETSRMIAKELQKAI